MHPVTPRHRLEYVLYVPLRTMALKLPERTVERLLRAAAVATYYLDRSRRKLALGNLDIAFGASKTKAEKRSIVIGSFRSLFFTYAEFLRLPRTIGDINSRVTIPNGTAPIRRALDAKRGVIYMISHFGNWELLAHRGLSISDDKIVSVGRPLANPLIYDDITRLRCLNGAVMLRKKWVLKDVLWHLKNNWCVAMLVDQYAGRSAPFAPFFGRPVSTTPAITLLAMKTGAAVIPVFNVRVRFGYHQMHVCEEVEMINSGDRESDIMENCSRFNRVLEEWIRRYPDHWMWMHRRFRRKKRPEEE